MLPYLYFLIILLLAVIVICIQSKGDTMIKLYGQAGTGNTFPAIPNKTLLPNHLTLLRMPNFINKLPLFDLTSDLAMLIQATAITDIMHDCACKSCGKHIESTQCIAEYALANNKLNEWTKTKPEREYVIFLIGLTLEDTQFWVNLFRDCKQEERQDTLIEVIKLSRADFGLQNHNLQSN